MAMDASVFETWADGSLRCIISPHKNEGSASMTNFVRQHMLSILGPVNEHVLELQQRAQQIQEGLEHAVERELEHRNAVDRHVKELFAQQDGILSSIREDIQYLQVELADSNRTHLDFEAALTETRNIIEATASHVKTNESRLADFKVFSESLDARISDIMPRFEICSKSIDQFRLEIGELQHSHVILQNRHADLSRCHAHTTQICEDTHERIGSLASQFETQKAEVSHSVVALHDRCFDNEKFTVELQDHVEGFEDRFRKMEGNVEFLMKNVCDVEKNIETWKDKSEAQEEKARSELAELATTAANVETVSERLSFVESSLSKLTKDVSSGTRKTALAHDEFDKQIGKTSAHVNKHTSEIHKLESVQQDILSTLQRNTDRVAQLGQQEHVWKERIETMDKALTGFRRFGEDASMKINNQALELEQGKMRHNQLNDSLEETTSALANLKDEFVSTSSSVHDMDARLDLAHEYIDGIGKGLQETHRHALIGTGGMLPPPSTNHRNSRILPGITSKNSTHKSAW